MRCPYTVGSLFAGIGGFDLGFERAGFETVWQVEINEWCRKVLEKNFPRAERYGDIRECGAHNLKPVDVMVGGDAARELLDRCGLVAGKAGRYEYSNGGEDVPHADSEQYEGRASADEWQAGAELSSDGYREVRSVERVGL